VRLRSLDSLRGIAAAGVVSYSITAFYIEHFTAHPETLPWFNTLHWFYQCGWNLVDFFFVLSGFIFMHVYSEKFQKTASVKDFLYTAPEQALSPSFCHTSSGCGSTVLQAICGERLLRLHV
jgi:peptidoglycan/LPS O-acetylase OafA/YrhL